MKDQLEKKIAEYLPGERKYFTINPKPKGTTFQQAVWEAMKQKPVSNSKSMSPDYGKERKTYRLCSWPGQ